MKETQQHPQQEAETVGMSRTPHTYQAFLLRLWQEEDSEHIRATLEDAQTGQRLGFANLQHLFAFIKQVTDYQSDKDDPLSS